MLTFNLSGVSCGRCEARITQALQQLDSEAVLQFSEDHTQLTLTSDLSAGEGVAAITESGYQAEHVSA